jgi:hypothetical protein
MAFNDFQYDSRRRSVHRRQTRQPAARRRLPRGATEIKSFHFDNREPDRRKTMIAFWEELLLSAADQLMQAGQGQRQEVVAGMKPRNAARCRTIPNAVFFYSFVQARGDGCTEWRDEGLETRNEKRVKGRASGFSRGRDRYCGFDSAWAVSASPSTAG